MDDSVRSQAATIVLAAAPSSPSCPDEGRFLPGTLFAGRYRIISLLGRGGMGEVYRATDLTLAQPVALKFLSEACNNSQRMLELFHNEVRVARQVSHPNVCRVYDVGESAGMPYISMEYVDGEDLETLLQRIGRLPSDKALQIARKICAGVAAAHDKGVLHRDLKPANVMLDRRGNVVVMDFGLAAVAQQLKGAEARSGTPAYMAPEQLRGEEVTAKSDIYALGLILYELFTGRRAYEAETLADLIRLQEGANITSMSSLASDCDIGVERAVRRCLDPVPARRPASALSVSAALPGGDPLAAALAAGETPSPELVAASGKTEGLPLKRSIPIILVLCALFVAVPYARTGVELHSLIPADYSAEELAAQVRQYAVAFGYAATPLDRNYYFRWNTDEVDNIRSRSKSKDERLRWYQGESPLQLTYRESPLSLVALPDGELSDLNPAPTTSGMVEAVVNSKGDLRRFRAVPPQVNRSHESASDLDVNLLSRVTGFDLSKWQDTPPPYTPLYGFDRLKAWKGRHPVLDVDVTVQASAWHGKVTELYVISPWTKPGRMPETQFSPITGRLILDRTISALIFLLSVFLAARNLRAGRGDVRGATRLAIAFSLCVGAKWLLRAHWTADFGMVQVLQTNASDWVMSGAMVWLLYIALEPVVRARWPHSLFTWSRVLVGRSRDPLVAAHVLYGALAGTLISAFFLGTQWYSAGHTASVSLANPNSGFGARFWIAGVLDIASRATEFGLLVVFALFCVRAVLRNDWISSVAVATILSLQEGDIWRGGYLDFAAFLVIFTSLVFVLLRLGLVATMIALFFINILLQTPGTQNFSKPYEWASVMYPALATAIALWAFWCTSREALLAGSPTNSVIHKTPSSLR